MLGWWFAWLFLGMFSAGPMCEKRISSNKWANTASVFSDAFRPMETELVDELG